MLQALTAVIAALTVIATALGILGAILQFTRSARLRRDVAFYREAAVSPFLNPTQASIAGSLHRDALGLLLARAAVSWTNFIGPIILATGISVYVFAMGFESPDFWDQSGRSLVKLLIGDPPFIVVFGTLIFFRLAYIRLRWLVSERRRVADEFRFDEGQIQVSIPPLLADVDIRKPSPPVSEKTLAVLNFIATAEVFLFGLAVRTRDDQIVLGQIALLMAFPLVVLFAVDAVRLIRKGPRRKVKQWRHPSKVDVEEVSHPLKTPRLRAIVTTHDPYEGHPKRYTRFLGRSCAVRPRWEYRRLSRPRPSRRTGGSTESRIRKD